METNLSRLLNFLPALVLVGFMIGCGGNTASDNTSPKGDGKAAPKSETENNSRLLMANKPKAQKRRDEAIAVNNAKQLVQDLTIYSDSDEGKLPVADKWGDAILQEMGTLAVFLSPQHPETAKLKAALPNGGALKEPQPNDDTISPPKDDNGTAPAPKRKPLQKEAQHSHYAFNKAMAGQSVYVNNGEPVLVFECDLGWNGAGGLADALKYMDKFKLEKIAVSSGDGFARAVTREELKKLKWEIAP